jgi:hypothetical protein
VAGHTTCDGTRSCTTVHCTAAVQRRLPMEHDWHSSTPLVHALTLVEWSSDIDDPVVATYCKQMY